MKNIIAIFGAIMILSILVSCSNQISSKEEALEVLKNSEWEEIHDTKGLGLGFDETSTYMYFDSEGLAYIYPQICVNGCDNPNTYYLDSDNRNKIAYFGFGRETITRNLKRVN